MRRRKARLCRPLNAVVAVFTEVGIVAVLDPTKNPPFWKFPGGKACDADILPEGMDPESRDAEVNFKNHSDPKATAIRELREETGIILDREDLHLILSEVRERHVEKEGEKVLYEIPEHDFVFFAAFLDTEQVKRELVDKRPGRAEQATVFFFEDFKGGTMLDFFSHHRRVLLRAEAQNELRAELDRHYGPRTFKGIFRDLVSPKNAPTT